MLVAKAKLALERTGASTLCVGGGVAANSVFRSQLDNMCRTMQATLVVPPLNLCTDNAAMAAVAVEKFNAGQFDTLDLDAVAGLIRKS